MRVIKREEFHKDNLEQRVMDVFHKAIDLMGGPRKLVEYRNLTWLPSLMTAAYVVVLSSEAGKTEDEIAAFLGISRQAVRMIRQADPAAVRERISGIPDKKRGYRYHIAGALARAAYQHLTTMVDQTART